MLTQLDTLIGFVVVMSVVSLLITIVTQIASSLLGLRGRNLSDALVAMIHKIDPALDEDAKALVDKVLTHPVISDSTLSMSARWLPLYLKRASAIRADELLGILEDISLNRTQRIPEEQKNAAIKLLGSLKTRSGADSAAVSALSARLPGLAGESFAQTVAVISQLEDEANVSLKNLKIWFESAEDRAQQWFAAHTRVITVFASIAGAFILQLDSFKLIQRISTDPDVRSKLVASVDAVQKEGDKVLENGPATRSIYYEVLPDLKNAYASIGTKLDNLPDLISNDAVNNWIRSQLAGDADLDRIVNDYNVRGQALAKTRISSLTQQISPIADQFGTSGLALLPSPYPSIQSGQWSWPLHHLLGIIASAALLSLGAPFWFNTLKTLTNLRPALANEVDRNPRQTPSKSPV